MTPVDPPANRRDRHVEFCAARDCSKEAIWASPIFECGVTFLVPVCREHGTPLSPIHGTVGLDNFMRRKHAPCHPADSAGGTSKTPTA